MMKFNAFNVSVSGVNVLVLITNVNCAELKIFTDQNRRGDWSLYHQCFGD